MVPPYLHALPRLNVKRAGPRQQAGHDGEGLHVHALAAGLFMQRCKDPQPL